MRIIAVTSRDLCREVSKWCFREDLFFRLANLPRRLGAADRSPRDVPALSAFSGNRVAIVSAPHGFLNLSVPPRRYHHSIGDVALIYSALLSCIALFEAVEQNFVLYKSAHVMDQCRQRNWN